MSGTTVGYFVVVQLREGGTQVLDAQYFPTQSEADDMEAGIADLLSSSHGCLRGQLVSGAHAMFPVSSISWVEWVKQEAPA